MTDTEARSSEPAVNSIEDEKIGALRQQLADLVHANAPAILQGAIEKAKQGHYSLTKLLLALAGIYPAPASVAESADHSLADFLCKELGLPEQHEAEHGQ
jgi:hypothetical protein